MADIFIVIFLCISINALVTYQFLVIYKRNAELIEENKILKRKTDFITVLTEDNHENH